MLVTLRDAVTVCRKVHRSVQRRKSEKNPNRHQSAGINNVSSAPLELFREKTCMYIDHYSLFTGNERPLCMRT